MRVTPRLAMQATRALRGHDHPNFKNGMYVDSKSNDDGNGDIRRSSEVMLTLLVQLDGHLG